MARSFDEVNDRLLAGANALFDLPDGDWALHIRGALSGGNAGNSYKYFWSLGAFGAQPSVNWYVQETGTGDSGANNEVRCNVVTDKGTTVNFFSTSNPGTSAAWQSWGLQRSGDTIGIWVDGVEEATATDASLDGINTSAGLYLGARNGLDSLRFFGGELGEPAQWNRALTADEWLALAAGWSPEVIPGRIWYSRLMGNASPEPDLVGDFTWTVTGATKADHPPLIMPSTPRLMAPIAAAGGASGTATVSGGGAVTGTAAKGALGDAGVSGTAGTAATASKGGLGGAAVSGTGAVAVSPIANRIGTATVTAVATTTVVPLAGRRGTTAVTAVGTAAATGTKAGQATAAITGGGAVVATGTTARFTQVLISANGNVAAAGARGASGAATNSGGGVAVVSGLAARFGSAVVIGAGTVAAVGTSATLAQLAERVHLDGVFAPRTTLDGVLAPRVPLDGEWAERVALTGMLNVA